MFDGCHMFGLSLCGTWGHRLRPPHTCWRRRGGSGGLHGTAGTRHVKHAVCQLDHHRHEVDHMHRVRELVTESEGLAPIGGIQTSSCPCRPRSSSQVNSGSELKPSRGGRSADPRKPPRPGCASRSRIVLTSSTTAWWIGTKEPEGVVSFSYYRKFNGEDTTPGPGGD